MLGTLTERLLSAKKCDPLSRSRKDPDLSHKVSVKETSKFNGMVHDQGYYYFSFAFRVVGSLSEASSYDSGTYSRTVCKLITAIGENNFFPNGSSEG
jgi:hypothetical protein